jgi:hypothetical protein
MAATTPVGHRGSPRQGGGSGSSHEWRGTGEGGGGDFGGGGRRQQTVMPSNSAARGGDGEGEAHGY